MEFRAIPASICYAVCLTADCISVGTAAILIALYSFPKPVSSFAKVLCDYLENNVNIYHKHTSVKTPIFQIQSLSDGRYHHRQKL